jgi:hypothetical protein
MLINNVNLKSDIFVKVNGKSLMLGKDKNLSVLNQMKLTKNLKNMLGMKLILDY